MEYPKEIYVKDYFEIHNYYSKIYGKNRTIILMQVGSFHECYSTDTEGVDLPKLAEGLDVICTRKNGNIPLAVNNPRMIGFPVYVTHNFIDKLIDMNYTIVLIDQVTEPPNPKRKVTNIYSPATYLYKKNISVHYLLSIVIEKIKNNICIGLSCYDLSTGDGSYFETHSTTNDILLGLDDTLRFIEKYPPCEIIIDHNFTESDTICNMNIIDITNYLSIDLNNCYTINITNHKKIAFQKQLLESIYKLDNNIDIIELLDLQFYNAARLSLVLLLDYISSHQVSLLKNISLPKLYTTSNYLYLGNRANSQLDVFTKNKDEKGLYDIINYTKTQIGKRFLYSQLSLPLTDTKELNKRYELIDTIIKGNHDSKLILFLEDIHDIDKLLRKLQMNIIQPCEFNELYISFYQIIKLCEYLENNKLTKLFSINNQDKLNIVNFIQYIENRFIIDKITNINFNKNDCYNSFYKDKIYPDIDNLEEKINTSQNFMINLIKVLENIMDDSVFKKKKNDDKSLITLKFTDKEGHCLIMTTKRAASLKLALDKLKIIKVGSIELNPNELEFIQQAKNTNTKINCKKMQEISNNLVNLKNELNLKLKENFKNDMNQVINLFGNNLNIWSRLIAFIDFINSGAICAINNHYTRPIICETKDSYFKSKECRHPIVENINTNYRYVPHDLELGPSTQMNGLLLYGINSSGKSTLMKSIGLNIILAQIGYYAACTKLEYSPYFNLMTRISGNDNMFKGQSSFMVEMMELMNILKRNNNKTLVIADEICRGTEEKSANIIVCYMLESLCKSNTSFITATHLHKIATMKTVLALDRVKSKHLKITHDIKQDKLVFDRNLTDGQGETFYGLQVAKYLMKDDKFNKRTSEILDEYDNNKIKKSAYNSSLYLAECFICKSKSNLESHHIIWQKDFDDKGYHNKFYIRKNDNSNLISLCMCCHDRVDRNEIIINGWIETSNGRELDYYLNTNITPKSKYTDELVNYIKSLKNIDVKIARIKIKETFDRKVSSASIFKIWENKSQV